jgi:methionyl-tRNA formyltransferase
VRILFAGSPGIAVPSLEAIAALGDLVGVLTNPPSAKGRGLAVSPTPVASAALGMGIPVLAPERLGPAEREWVGALKPDILAVFAYGRIFGPKFMALFPRGGINAHPSLLPRWRGPAPIPYAILHRDPVTGVSIQRVAPELDSGDVLARQVIPLAGDETAESLSEIAAATGARLFVQALRDIESGTEVAERQDGSAATWSRVIVKEDGLIDWTAAALEIDARSRAFKPWPGVYTDFTGQRLAILELHPWPDEDAGLAPGTVISVDKSRGIMVQTGRGLAALERLQVHGKKAMVYKDFANGARGLVGSRLGSSGAGSTAPFEP